MPILLSFRRFQSPAPAGFTARPPRSICKSHCKDSAPHLHSHTYQEVIAEHAKKRKQFKTDKLRRLCSGGSKRALGWIPFKVGSAVWKNGQVRYNGQFFKVWDSDGLSQYPFRSGCFSEDARGRWYFNVAVSVPIQHNGQASAIGIDLGLKNNATCSDGVKLEASQFYRALEPKLATAQRVGNQKQVRTIHAKIKNRRKDAIHTFTNLITRSHGMIVVGDVSRSKLVKTKMAKSVLDAGWFMLKTQLTYVKSREIIYPLFEAFGAFLLPVFECLNRCDVSQRLLRDLVIV